MSIKAESKKRGKVQKERNPVTVLLEQEVCHEHGEGLGFRVQGSGFRV